MSITVEPTHITGHVTAIAEKRPRQTQQQKVRDVPSIKLSMLTEQELSERWQISVKTLRRWRQNKVGPVWRKLFRHVRYHNSDVLDFERQSAQNWMGFLGRDEKVPIILTFETINDGPGKVDQDSDTASPYLTGKDVAAITGLPAHLFADREERDSKQIPYMSLVGSVRYTLEEILRWELANSTPGITPDPVVPSPDITTDESQASAPLRIPRWHEIIEEQVEERFNSLT